MGRLKAGLYHTILGKVGNLIHSTWKDKDTVRLKPRKSKKRRSAQTEHRTKFRIATKFVCKLSDLFKITYKNYEQQMTARNNAMGQVLKEAITGTYPNYSIDYSKVKISKGSLKNETDVTISISGGTLQWQWAHNYAQTGAKAEDIAIAVVYCPFFEHYHYTVHGSQRSSNIATLDVSAFMGQTVYTWIAFRTPDMASMSDSLYTGSIVVE